MPRILHYATAFLLASALAVGAQTFDAKDRQPTPEELSRLPVVVPEKAAALLQDVKAPEGFDVSIFAHPPAVNYPVFVAATPDGTLYVSSDGNGSLDRKPHLGRVLRVRDTDHDGKADEVKAFVPDVDSPRGLVWDHDRLYLLHPPDISVYLDKNGDGVADEHRTLVSGIAFTFKDRPADHSSNGLELGVDGWLYAAIGDFGFLEAKGTDGRTLQLRGGGVVRVRPDGTGLEIWADGTRNILEAAISPLLDGFARDNTNDGGGWDIRLHHFSGHTQHGYPRLFKNFPDEIIQPLADYGGGSGCGAAWIDEPGIPEKWNNAPFTADWGTEWIYRHGLAPTGATYTATQEKFLRLPRATDLDVDGNGAIYASSWRGASFTWVGPEVGFIVRLTPKGYQSPPLLDFDKASDSELIEVLASPSQRRRLAAQRTLLRRGSLDLPANAEPPVLADPASPLPAARLAAFASDPARPLAGRIAALFALEQALGSKAHEFLGRLSSDAAVAPWALRALADQPRVAKPTSISPLRWGLRSRDPRARKEAAIAIARLDRPENAGLLTGVLNDPDPIVAHAAQYGLTRLGASAACLPIVDHAETGAPIRKAALRVLQSLHEPGVVEALVARLEKETNVVRRAGLVTALCRLHFKEGPWKGDSWGTRPDTRGPYYQPEAWSETPRIAAALKATLDKAAPDEAAAIAQEFARHRIPAGDALGKLIAGASANDAVLPALAAQLAESDVLPPEAVPLLAKAAMATAFPDAARAQALIALARTDRAEGWRAILAALPKLGASQTENNLTERARNALRNAPRLEAGLDAFVEEAARAEGEGSQFAEAALIRLAGRKTGAPEIREAAAKAIDAGWAAGSKRRIQILRASAEQRDASRATSFVAALEDSDPTVVAAARDAVKRLRIDPERIRGEAKAPKIGDLEIEKVLANVVGQKGEIALGEQLFTQLACVNCHTVKAGEPLKGPFLGTIAVTYRRRELAEAILLPSKTLAQGFVTQHLELKDGTELDGFVVLEAADAVTIRTVNAEERRIPLSTIAKREKTDRSIMPEGLAAGLTLRQFASILDYLESLAKPTP